MMHLCIMLYTHWTPLAESASKLFLQLLYKVLHVIFNHNAVQPAEHIDERTMYLKSLRMLINSRSNEEKVIVKHG